MLQFRKCLSWLKYSPQKRALYKSLICFPVNVPLFALLFFLKNETEFFRWVYEYLRLPLVPLYGNFPVKLRTFLGKPILYQPKVTAEELAEQVSIYLPDL